MQPVAHRVQHLGYAKSQKSTSQALFQKFTGGYTISKSDSQSRKSKMNL